jgi:hypothetical protein
VCNPPPYAFDLHLVIMMSTLMIAAIAACLLPTTPAKECNWPIQEINQPPVGGLVTDQAGLDALVSQGCTMIP